MPSAAILAGGQATRFGGRDKSALVVGGRSILARQVEQLSQVTDDILLVGSTTLQHEATGNSVRAVRDRLSGQGPMAGLDAALAAARHDLVIVVACDMPFITARFFEHLLSVAEGWDAVVPRSESGYHPLCAVYSRGCALAVARCLSEERLALKSLLGAIRTRVVDTGEDADAWAGQRVFTNINTPADLSCHQSSS